MNLQDESKYGYQEPTVGTSGSVSSAFAAAPFECQANFSASNATGTWLSFVTFPITTSLTTYGSYAVFGWSPRGNLLLTLFNEKRKGAVKIIDDNRRARKYKNKTHAFRMNKSFRNMGIMGFENSKTQRFTLPLKKVKARVDPWAKTIELDITKEDIQRMQSVVSVSRTTGKQKVARKHPGPASTSTPIQGHQEGWRDTPQTSMKALLKEGKQKLREFNSWVAQAERSGCEVHVELDEKTGLKVKVKHEVSL